MKRSPIRRRTPLRHRSAKRAAREQLLRELRVELLATRRSCEAEWFGFRECSGRREVHHVQRRSQGGLHAPENLLVVCAAHHEAIHANPADAVRAGLLTGRAA